MRLGTPQRLLLAFAALALSISGTALASEDTTTQRTFYLRNDGADCGTGAHPFLADAPGTKDLGCGYIGGGPFGEVFKELGVDTAKVYATETPLTLKVDALRNLGGKITVTPYVNSSAGVGSGVGNVTVDVVATALTASNEQLELGGQSSTVLSTPVASRQVVPINIDIPDALNGADITELYLSVNIRGVHAAHGFNELNGSSLVTVPFQPVVEATPTPAPAP